MRLRKKQQFDAAEWLDWFNYRTAPFPSPYEPVSRSFGLGPITVCATRIRRRRIPAVVEIRAGGRELRLCLSKNPYEPRVRFKHPLPHTKGRDT